MVRTYTQARTPSMTHACCAFGTLSTYRDEAKNYDGELAEPTILS